MVGRAAANGTPAGAAATDRCRAAGAAAGPVGCWRDGVVGCSAEDGIGVCGRTWAHCNGPSGIDICGCTGITVRFGASCRYTHSYVCIGDR